MMNRLFGGGKAKGPQATNLQTQKSKQIESLRKTNLSVVEVVRDVDYRVSYQSGSVNLSIIINLPVQFPQEKPVITIHPPVQHPWVDIQMKVTGCPNINNFSMHSDLGGAIQAIVEEFKRTPPRILPHLMGQQFGGSQPPIPPVGPGYPLYGPPPTLGGGGVYSAAGPPPLPPRAGMENGREGPPNLSNSDHSIPNTAYSIPDISKAFPDLKDKRLMDLQELVDNEEKILEMIQSLPELAAFSQDRENVSARCVELAQENMAKKPQIDELKAVVSEKISQLEAMKGEFESDCERHLELSDQFHPTHIQTNLKVAVLEAEEESEKMADDFLDKKVDIDEFLQKYMQQRTLCHLRKAKEEKLNQIIMATGGSGY